MGHLKEKGVEMIMGERVTSFDPIKKQYVCASGFRFDFDPDTSREFWCTGYNLDFNKTILGSSLQAPPTGFQDKDGGIKCKMTHQLSDQHPNIFLAGDMVARRHHPNGERMAFHGAVQAMCIMPWPPSVSST